MSRVRDTRIVSYEPLLSPAALLDELRLTEQEAETVERTRADVRALLDGADDRLLVITGPCSVHDPKAALEYARRLVELRETYSRDLLIVMRVYFEKPRTVTGWKGLINDPLMDDSYDVHRGLRTARRLLIDILSLGMPVGCEWLDPITPQYIADTVTWGAIGARTTESQVHRQLASGLSMPVGFKNGTDGDVQVAVDACRASAAGHTFFGVTSAGAAAVVSTSGNVDTHVILRGGRSGPNYSASHVAKALDLVAAAGLPRRLMVDASHDNSGKDYRRQPAVAQTLAEQIAAGERGVSGVMLESFLVAGRQSPGDPATLTYGQSVTDACMDIEMTAATLHSLAAAVSQRRQFSSDLSRTVPDRLSTRNDLPEAARGELGADLLSVGVVEFVEDYQGPLPVVAGGARVAGGEANVAEVGEGIGLLVTVTELPDEREGVQVALDGPDMMPEMLVSVAEAVPRVSPAVQVAELGVDDQGLLAWDEGRLGVAEQCLEPADSVQGAREPAPVAHGPGQLKALTSVLERRFQAIPPPAQDGQVMLRVCLPGLVSGLDAQAEGITKVRVGVVEAVQPCAGTSKRAACPRLHGRVRQPVRGGHRGPARGSKVVPVPLPVEEGRHRPGELPGVGLVSGRDSMTDRGKQHPVFDGEPVHGLLIAGCAFRVHSGPRRPERQGLVGLGEQQGGGVRAVQVMVEDTAGRGAAVFFGVDGVREMGRVVAQQVVEGVPARDMLDEQAGLGQLGQQGARFVGRQPGEAGRGQGVGVLARVQAEQPEQPRRRRGERLVGPGQDGTHIAGRVVVVGQCLPPLLRVAQLVGQKAQRHGGPHSRAGGHQGQCQGQPGAAVDDLRDRGRLGVHPVGAQPTAQQQPRLGSGEQVQGQRIGAGGRD